MEGLIFDRDWGIFHDFDMTVEEGGDHPQSFLGFTYKNIRGKRFFHFLFPLSI